MLEATEGEDRSALGESALLNSDDVASRKLGREMRLKRRHEAAKKLKEVIEGGAEETEDKSRLMMTLKSSNKDLFEVYLEGKGLVTNIRVSADTREMQRREDEIANRDARLAKFEEEAACALEKLNNIAAKWDEISASNDPLELSEELKMQSAQCLDLVEQKEHLISEFKVELKVADERYMKDRSEMLEDIAIIARRIDEQVLIIKKRYLAEVVNIEGAVDQTRNEVVAKEKEDWKALYQKREENEVANIAASFEMRDANQEEVHHVHNRHDELYRETKIRLDTDVQALEQELEHIKALCLVNSEKLDYNYQVLKKREDENVIIKNNQKRTICKLLEEASKMRKEIDEKQAETDHELKKIGKEVCRLRRNIVDIEKKADHFAEVNEIKFQTIWDMKSKEAHELVEKIMTADKLIHNEILGLEWVPPEMRPLKKEDLISYQAAMAILDEVSSDKEEKPMKSSWRLREFTPEDRDRLLQQILHLVADQSGFLIEEKLDFLLTPYTEKEKTLVRLENVFEAVGLTREDDIDLLLDFFLPYSYCKICNDCGSVSASGLAPPLPPEELSTSTSSKLSMQRAMCQGWHPLVIEKAHVLKAFREFVTRLHSHKLKVRQSRDVKVAKDRYTISRLLSFEDLDAYWARFRQIFPDGQEAIWDALCGGLQEYHNILQERGKLNEKAQSLKQQNMELWQLVEKYVPRDGRLSGLAQRRGSYLQQQHHSSS